MTAVALQVLPVTGLGEITAGDDLAALIAGCCDLHDGDIVVVAQKVVSKAEGALVHPQPGEGPADARRRLAREQAARVVADAPWGLIVQTRHGLVCANAGVDASNVPDGGLALLPADPDASARRLREGLANRTRARVGVIVSDTFGRPWRLGQTDVAIGLAGFAPVRDERGGRDRQGVPLEVTEAAVADELAGAADLVRAKADGVPVVVIRGAQTIADESASARDLVRPAELDLFPRGRGGLADAIGARTAVAAGPVAEHDLGRALAAVDRVTGGRVRVRRVDDGAGSTRLAVAGDDDRETGLAAGVLLAALTDLGYDAVLAPIAQGLAVIAGGAAPGSPEPPPPSDR